MQSVVSKTPADSIRKVTMPSFGQCCRRHIVGQPAVSDVSTVCSYWHICRLCSESNNTDLLARLLTAVLKTSIFLHIPNTVCPTTWRCIIADYRYRI